MKNSQKATRSVYIKSPHKRTLYAIYDRSRIRSIIAAIILQYYSYIEYLRNEHHFGVYVIVFVLSYILFIICSVDSLTKTQ